MKPTTANPNSDRPLPLAGVVPAYMPTAELPRLLREVLAEADLAEIIVTDDGSGEKYAAIFRETAAIDGVRVLHHAGNCGTGAAIKSALQSLLQSGKEYAGVVTFDADFQHRPADVAQVAEAFRRNPAQTILGVRDFHGGTSHVPWRSRFGNRFTEKMFRIFTGIHVSDTQTGLRAYPRKMLSMLTKIPQDGYDFQLEALILAAQNTPIAETPIATVYENGNASSHFHPLRDSLRVSCVLLRFAASSIVCCAVDYAVFALLNYLGGKVLLPLIAARVVSVALNFILNRNQVFRSAGSPFRQGIQFAMLAIFLVAASYCGITFLRKTLHWHPAAGKLVVESALFVLSYLVQKRCIFPKNQ